MANPQNDNEPLLGSSAAKQPAPASEMEVPPHYCYHMHACFPASVLTTTHDTGCAIIVHDQSSALSQPTGCLCVFAQLPACCVLCMQVQVASEEKAKVLSEANNYATTKSVTQVIFTTSAIASNVTLWNQVGWQHPCMGTPWRGEGFQANDVVSIPCGSSHASSGFIWMSKLS